MEKVRFNNNVFIRFDLFIFSIIFNNFIILVEGKELVINIYVLFYIS